MTLTTKTDGIEIWSKSVTNAYYKNTNLGLICSVKSVNLRLFENNGNKAPGKTRRARCS